MCCWLVVVVCFVVVVFWGGAGKRKIGKQTKTDRQADNEIINKMLNERYHNHKQNI